LAERWEQIAREVIHPHLRCVSLCPVDAHRYSHSIECNQLSDAVASALLEADRSAREECAKIAEPTPPVEQSVRDDETGSSATGREIAAAIRTSIHQDVEKA
jgi:hypothetical protein